MDIYKQYINHGWCVEPQFFNETELNYLFKNIDKYIEKHKDKLECYDINYTSNGRIYSIHCLHKFDNIFKNFLYNNKKLMSKFKKILNCEEEDVEITEIQCFFKPPKSLMESPMHQDNGLWCLNDNRAFTAWVPFDNVNHENSGLKIWPKTHLLGDLNHVASYKVGTSRTIDQKEFNKFNINSYIINNLNKGDMQIHNCRTIHGSDVNNSNKKRRAFVFGVKHKRNNVNKEKMKERMKSLLHQQKLIKNTNILFK